MFSPFICKGTPTAGAMECRHRHSRWGTICYGLGKVCGSKGGAKEEVAGSNGFVKTN